MNSSQLCVIPAMRFDLCAHTYDEFGLAQKVFAERLADFIQAPRGACILELGSGTGGLTSHLCSRGFRVHATDISPRMVVIGQETVPFATWSTLDAFNDPIPPSDLQVSSGLVHWSSHPVQTL